MHAHAHVHAYVCSKCSGRAPFSHTQHTNTLDGVPVHHNTWENQLVSVRPSMFILRRKGRRKLQQENNCCAATNVCTLVVILMGTEEMVPVSTFLANKILEDVART